ncbi:MAG: hypothetical protein MR385_07950, partial [Treponema berlinense]|nr:hypothetical protein [Treponema berlinense]
DTSSFSVTFHGNIVKRAQKLRKILSHNIFILPLRNGFFNGKNKVEKKTKERRVQKKASATKCYQSR